MSSFKHVFILLAVITIVVIFKLDLVSLEFKSGAESVIMGLMLFFLVITLIIERALDVILTSGLIAGGSDGIHKTTDVLRVFMETNSAKLKKLNQ